MEDAIYKGLKEGKILTIPDFFDSVPTMILADRNETLGLEVRKNHGDLVIATEYSIRQKAWERYKEATCH